MTTLTGKSIIDGQASGPALISRQPFNFTAALTKPVNVLRHKRSEIGDKHHDLCGEDVKGKVMILPSCIGSTHTGLVLLDLVSRETGPAAVIVGTADSLLVSGVILSEVWFDRSIPIVELHDDKLFELAENGDIITVNDGVITITAA